jgi:hypothetical protein
MSASVNQADRSPRVQQCLTLEVVTVLVAVDEVLVIVHHVQVGESSVAGDFQGVQHHAVIAVDGHHDGSLGVEFPERALLRARLSSLFNGDVASGGGGLKIAHEFSVRRLPRECQLSAEDFF